MDRYLAKIVPGDTLYVLNFMGILESCSLQSVVDLTEKETLFGLLSCILWRSSKPISCRKIQLQFYAVSKIFQIRDLLALRAYLIEVYMYDEK